MPNNSLGVFQSPSLPVRQSVCHPTTTPHFSIAYFFPILSWFLATLVGGWLGISLSLSWQSLSGPRTMPGYWNSWYVEAPRICAVFHTTFCHPAHTPTHTHTHLRRHSTICLPACQSDCLSVFLQHIPPHWHWVSLRSAYSCGQNGSKPSENIPSKPGDDRGVLLIPQSWTEPRYHKSKQPVSGTVSTPCLLLSWPPLFPTVRARKKQKKRKHFPPLWLVFNV